MRRGAGVKQNNACSLLSRSGNHARWLIRNRPSGLFRWVPKWAGFISFVHFALAANQQCERSYPNVN